jgi:hypothetical protein
MSTEPISTDPVFNNPVPAKPQGLAAIWETITKKGTTVTSTELELAIMAKNAVQIIQLLRDMGWSEDFVTLAVSAENLNLENELTSGNFQDTFFKFCNDEIVSFQTKFVDKNLFGQKLFEYPHFRSYNTPHANEIQNALNSVGYQSDPKLCAEKNLENYLNNYNTEQKTRNPDFKDIPFWKEAEVTVIIQGRKLTVKVKLPDWENLSKLFPTIQRQIFGVPA